MSTTFSWFPKPLRPTTHDLPYELGSALAYRHDCGNLIELDGMELDDRHVGWLEGYAAASPEPRRSEVRALIAAIARHGTLVLVVEP